MLKEKGAVLVVARDGRDFPTDIGQKRATLVVKWTQRFHRRGMENLFHFVRVSSHKEVWTSAAFHSEPNMRRDTDIQHLRRQSVFGCWTRAMEQSPISPERCWLIVQWILAIVKDISVWGHGAVWTLLTAPMRNIRTYLLKYSSSADHVMLSGDIDAAVLSASSLCSAATWLDWYWRRRGTYGSADRGLGCQLY